MLSLNKPWRHMEEWGYISLILNHITGWKKVDSFMIQLLYPQGKWSVST
jgi:hypothetical protein